MYHELQYALLYISINRQEQSVFYFRLTGHSDSLLISSSDVVPDRADAAVEL